MLQLVAALVTDVDDFAHCGMSCCWGVLGEGLVGVWLLGGEMGAEREERRGGREGMGQGMMRDEMERALEERGSCSVKWD